MKTGTEKILRKVQQIRELKEQGMTQNEIGRAMNCDQAGVSYLSRKYGIEWPKPNFIDGLGKSTIERLTRKVVLESERSLFICERCGGVSISQEQPRHHKDRDRSNNSPSNLEVLCTSCHTLEHAHERIRGKDGRYIA
jgi:predicted transcriptional regulator